MSAQATTVRTEGWMQWFLGASEKELIYERRAELFQDGAFVNAGKGWRWPAGTFDYPSVQDLLDGVQAMPESGAVRDVPLNVVDGIDIGVLQAELKTEQRAMVQIASNFNCLEMGSTTGRPDGGYLVEGQASDCTQGPAATFGVPAAALLRAHYPFYAPDRDPMEWGQTMNRQVELLEDVTQWFGSNIPNGKVILSGAEDHDVPTDRVAARIRVGVHGDAQVVFGRSGTRGMLDVVPEPRPFVDQAVVASVPWRSRGQVCGKERRQLEDVTRAALRAAYQGTYLAAIARGRKLLLLTLVGSAAFQNPLDMVLEELAAAHQQWAGHPSSSLEEVRVCVYQSGGAPAIRKAIELASESLKNVKFIQEKKLVTKFLDEIAQDTGKYCFGMKETIQGLEMGAVESLICWESLEMLRVVIRNPHTDVEQTHYITPEQAKDPKLYRDPDSNVELETTSSEPFVEWIAVNYKTFGTELDFITDKSQEGNQFVKGFDGIGGLLRYRVEFEQCDEPDLEVDSDDDFM